MLLHPGFLGFESPIFHHYLFHFVCFSILMLALPFLAKSEDYQHSLGFIYLGFLGLKLLIFALVFKQQLFEPNSTNTIPVYNYLIPVVVGLGVEVLFLRRILNSITWKS